MIRVVIPGEPCAQGRPRVAVIAGRPRVYDPGVSRSWKGAARHEMAAAALDASPIGRRVVFPEGPLEVLIRAYHACPKTDYRKREPTPRRWRDRRPDLENVVKAILDAATGVIWRDDAQVASLVVEQFTAAQGEAPRVELEVRALPIYVSDEVEKEESHAETTLFTNA